MNISKTIEVVTEGDSIEAAVSSAVKEAGRSVRNIENVKVTDIEALVEGNDIAAYRVTSKITFAVGEPG